MCLQKLLLLLLKMLRSYRADAVCVLQRLIPVILPLFLAPPAPQVLAGPVQPPCLVPVSPRWSQASRPRRVRLGPRSPSVERTWARARPTSLVTFFFFLTAWLAIFFFFWTSLCQNFLKKICLLLSSVSDIHLFSMFFTKYVHCNQYACQYNGVLYVLSYILYLSFTLAHFTLYTLPRSSFRCVKNVTLWFSSSQIWYWDDFLWGDIIKFFINKPAWNFL